MTYFSILLFSILKVGVVGELVAFIAFLSLSISVFLESLKHIIDIIFVIPKQESNSTILFTAHGERKFCERRKCSIEWKSKIYDLDHIHSLIDRPELILGVGIYATVSGCLLGIAILCK